MNKRYLAYLWVALILPANGVLGETTIDYSSYGRLLHAYVKDGKVNYEGFRREVGILQAFIDETRGVHPDTLGSKEAQMAFWINAYNAIVIKAVIDRYHPSSALMEDGHRPLTHGNDGPIQSVMDVKGFFDKIIYTVGGETLTLNEIEAKARAFKDPRVHFAVVCASSSCPILRPEAYVPDRLELQLASQAREFLANPQRGLRLDDASGVADLSQIFKWYAPDFVGNGLLTKVMGSDKILKALAPMMDDTIRRQVARRSWKIEYMPYDWSLNKQDVRIAR